jgi:hypothetical protein
MSPIQHPTAEEVAAIERHARALRAQAMTEMLRGAYRAIAGGIHALGARLGMVRPA